MSQLLQRIKNKAWQLRQGRGFGYAPFFEPVNDAMRAEFAGSRAAEIFFANDGAPVFKWLHYLPIYDDLLRAYIDTPAKMLEIGVLKGGSLRMWRKLLGDKATLYGIDIDPSCAAFDAPDAHVRIGSQDDHIFLRKVVEEMGGLDIVLDDGSHVGRHQIASFDALWPLLSEGGIYIIEDCHSAYWPEWDGGLRRKGTIIEFFKDRIDKMHAHYIDKGQAPGDVAGIFFFDSIIAVKKLRQNPRKTTVVPHAEV